MRPTKCAQARTVIVVFETDLPVRPQPTYRYIYSGSAMQVGLREREQAAARAGLALTHALTRQAEARRSRKSVWGRSE